MLTRVIQSKIIFSLEWETTSFQKSNILQEQNFLALACEIIVISQGIIKETMVPNTREAAEVVSEDKDTMVSIEELDYPNGSVAKGSKERLSLSKSLQKNK